MLVFSRKIGEGLWIGNSRLVVIDCAGGRIRLGVTAPPAVSVDRDEVRRSKELVAQRRRAAADSAAWLQPGAEDWDLGGEG